MNPLDALTALTPGAAALPGMGAVPTTPTVQGAPISEGFSLPGSTTVPEISAPSVALAPTDNPSTWGHMVQQMVMNVNTQQHSAAEKVSDVLQGGPTPVHDALIATQEAGLSFQFLSEVRNKVLDAYQQIMQMQV